MPDNFVADQWALNKRIVARQTELGIGSILPAFQGNVPDGLRTMFPAANISTDGWLDGLDPLVSSPTLLALREVCSRSPSSLHTLRHVHCVCQ